MSLRRRLFIVISVLCLGLIQISMPGQAQNIGRHRMIHLRSEGPRPEVLTVKVGMPVVWQSHVAHTSSVVVTVAFLKGKDIAQVTQPVELMNGFVLEGSHFVGRMAGNGGTVALKFTTPGEYPYTLGRGDGVAGSITVKP